MTVINGDSKASSRGGATGNLTTIVNHNGEIAGEITFTNGKSNTRSADGFAGGNGISLATFAGTISGNVTATNGDSRVAALNAGGNGIGVSTSGSVVATNGNSNVRATSGNASANSIGITLAPSNAMNRTVQITNGTAQASAGGDSSDANGNRIVVAFDEVDETVTANIEATNGRSRVRASGEDTDANGNFAEIRRETLVGTVNLTNGETTTSGEGLIFGNTIRADGLNLTGNLHFVNESARVSGQQSDGAGGQGIGNWVDFSEGNEIHGDVTVDQGDGSITRRDRLVGPLSGIQTGFRDSVFHGNVIISTGHGSVTMGELSNGAGIRFQTFNNTHFAGNVTYNEGTSSLRAGDNPAGAGGVVLIFEAVVDNLFTLNGTDSDNQVNISESIINNLDLNLNDGDDFVFVSDTQSTGIINYNGGAGTDELVDFGGNNLANGIDLDDVEIV